MSSKRVVILNNCFNDLETLNLIKLKHPKSNELNYFLLTETNKNEYDLFELVNYHVEMGSLFIDNYVQSDYLIYLASKIDFTYFLISLLYNQTSDDSYTSLKDLKLKFLELNSINKDTTEADIILNKLKVNDDSKFLEKVFDIDEKIKLKYNQVKCIKWLKQKFEQIRSYLETKVIESKAAVKSKKQESETGEEKLNYEAFELISQYLDKGLVDKFRKELGLNNPLDDNGNTNKRPKPQEITLE